MCHKAADLQDSHLLPSALYKRFKEPRLKNPNPLVVSPGVAVPSSLEVRQYFLCRDCEDRFNRFGEKWAIANCSQPDGAFPLHDNLTAFPEAVRWGRVALYRGKGVAGIDPDQLSYFACSVFWRASATQWRNHHDRIEMGPYEERFRLHLLGLAPFPECAALRLVISSPAAAKLLAVLPMTDRIGGMRCYTFYIPGMIFTLVLAQHIPVEFKQVTLNGSPDRPIGVSDDVYREAMTQVATALKSAHPKGYLQDFWKGPDPRPRMQ